MSHSPSSLLGSHPTSYTSFTDLEKTLELFKDESFLSLTIRKRFRKTNEHLLSLIQKSPNSSFLLGAVLEFIDRVNDIHILNDLYTFTSFEFWLLHFSGLSDEETYTVRGKISGKLIPRSDYQPFFPVGMNRVFQGTHFVVAHLSPDADTMIASFWGWVDAFAARVGSGLHHWSLPGGPPNSPVTVVLDEMLGSGLFTSLARTSLSLTLTAMDLITQQNWNKKLGETLTTAIDSGFSEKATTLVNEQGHYLGDWRSSDFEVVRQVAILYKSTLRWFENNFHTKLISLFAAPDLKSSDLPELYSSVFDIKIKDCEPALEFSEKQSKDLDRFFIQILRVKNGIEGTFEDLIHAFNALSFTQMQEFQLKVESLGDSGLFDSQGNLVENRPEIFHRLDTLISELDAAMKTARNYVERLDVVIDIKHKVLNHPFVYLTLFSDVDEIRKKMQAYDYLTVVINEQDGSLFPVGIIRDTDLRKNSLGTVSLRDFCNLDEMKKATYLEVISVVDHHKSALQTFCVPCAIIGDAQSCNVLIAEQAFIINDRYSQRGMSLAQIEEQIQKLSALPFSPSNSRLLQRLLQRKETALRGDNLFIHPQREYNEYLCYLQAILDDTDLLSKVSKRDIDCVTELLNRMKTLSIQQETEIIKLDEIPKDHDFPKAAATCILKNEDMYSIYKKTFDYRETEVEHQIRLCADGLASNFFADTKEQNGCARVGQTKMFSSNFKSFSKNGEVIRGAWLDKAMEIYKSDPEIDLHIHMISTISSAEEVYNSSIDTYAHQDELWIWIPSTKYGNEHLATFLSNFQPIIKSLKNTLRIELYGSNTQELQGMFRQYLESFQIEVSEESDKGPSIMVLRFKPGSINSRKSMITPNLPRLVP